MTVTSTDPIQDPAVETAETLTNNVPDAAAEMAANQADFGTDEDLGIPDDIPTADDPSSRAANRDMDNAGFTLDEFAALLSKYDYNFKPGDIVNGTVFALESKGAMIDIGAKTAAFMPLQEVSINRVEGLGDVLQPGEIREFFIMSEENEDGQLSLSIRRIEYQRAWERGSPASERRRHDLFRGVCHQPRWCIGPC